MAESNRILSFPNEARYPSETKQSLSVSVARLEQLVTTIKSGLALQMESGPGSTFNEDREQTDWWICYDDPGPAVGTAFEVIVDSFNWKDFGKHYRMRPNKYNYRSPSMSLVKFIRHPETGLVMEIDLGTVLGVEVIENWPKDNYSHKYTILPPGSEDEDD
jgi:hypothetical protein